MIRSFAFILLTVLIVQCSSFAPVVVKGSRALTLTITREKQDENVDTTSKNPLELASWYAVEAFGRAFGSKKSSGDQPGGSGSIDLSIAPSSLDETLQRIKIDNDRSYFLSGEVDRLIYDVDCTFADPFVSFDGRDRFIENLANLGSFITKYDAKMINYEVEDGGKEVKTKVGWRFDHSCIKVAMYIVYVVINFPPFLLYGTGNGQA